MTNATKYSMERDNDHHAARAFADVMVNLLRDFIPENCRDAARQSLYEKAFTEKFELTTWAMRKEYEAWKSTQLDMLNTGIGTVRINADGSIEHISREQSSVDGQSEQK